VSVQPRARVCQTRQEMRLLTDKIRRSKPDTRIVYDIESGASPQTHELFGDDATLLPYAGAYLTGMSIAIVESAHTFVEGRHDILVGHYVPLGHEKGNIDAESRRMLTEALGETEARHVGFNTPFDWAFLLNEGLLLDVPVNAHDVQIKRWLQDENGVKKLKLLGEMWLGEDAAAEKRELDAIMAAPYSKITDARNAVLAAYPELGYYKIKGEKVPYDGRDGKKLWPNDEAERMAVELRRRRRWSQLTVEELGPYAARDATLTAELDHLLDYTSPNETIEREMKVNAICIDMTRRGVSVDIDQLHYAALVYAKQEAELRAELKEVHGLENPGSGPQVADLLYNRLGLPVRGTTPGGDPSTDKNALEQLAGDPTAAKILACRKANKARTAYAEAFAKFAEHSHDGRVHGMYGTTRTVTGRLAASNPNVMTIPREESLPEVRQAFMLDPKHGVERLGFDLASAELWVTASITGDPVLTEVLLEGRNLHAEMMVQVFGGEKDKSRREYTLSKNVNYGIEYGAGLDQITIFAAKAGYSPKEARRVAKIARDGHKALFAEQHRMADWWARKAEELGYLPLNPEGRKRHFRSPGKTIHAYTALNALVQGGVAEFMKDTMIEVYKRGYGELLILQVHDELVFDAPANKGMEAELLRVLQQISHDINPFRYELTWEPKAWTLTAP
jgi:DNA polymerase I-like protein with 3'-5' exonuclease and polymerase domains